ERDRRAMILSARLRRAVLAGDLDRQPLQRVVRIVVAGARELGRARSGRVDLGGVGHSSAQQPAPGYVAAAAEAHRVLLRRKVERLSGEDELLAAQAADAHFDVLDPARTGRRGLAAG